MLENKTIISTRPIQSDKPLIDLLQKDGAKYISMPMIEPVLSILNPAEKAILSNIEQFDWLIFTSGNGVRFFFEQLEKFQIPKVFPDTLKTAVIGKSTAKELLRHGLQPAFVGKGKTSADLANEIQSQFGVGSQPKLLIAQGNLASPVLENKLSKVSRINRIIVYNTLTPKNVSVESLQRIINNDYDLILLASPSALNNLCAILAPLQAAELRLACIGPTTQKAVEKLGAISELVANESTSLGMYKSIKDYFDKKN
ncbi:MAG: uroporphyrinogen-III synthase [Bacteroidota bacterium]|jgi:uroporphyrinogen-III synthase